MNIVKENVKQVEQVYRDFVSHSFESVNANIEKLKDKGLALTSISMYFPHHCSLRSRTHQGERLQL